jgi:peroxidase
MAAGGTLVAILVCAVFFTAIVLPPALSSAQRVENPTPLPFLLAFETPASEWQFHACGCNNSWSFGTDERNVSNAFFQQVTEALDPRGLSAMAAFWGQVIDHDVTMTNTNASDGMFTIPMTPQDDVLMRLKRANHRTLQNGCRETLNAISPQIDASFVYGDASTISQIRNGTTCRLLVSDGNLLPLSTTHPNEFIAGDVRATEHAILASLHTIWMREHNRLCSVLETEQPTWTEEQRFWKARQVVIAKVQHITYTEWLPAIMGSQIGLLESTPIKGDGLRINMEFSVLAYRFGHSMIPDIVAGFTLPELFFNRTLLMVYGVETFLSGAYGMVANRIDNQIVDGLRSFLFATHMGVMGEDLISRNLFAARERGMPTYGAITQCFGTSAISVASQEAWVGMLSEPLVSGSSFPRTIATIVAEQMKRLRLYDPRFYDTAQNKALIGGRFIAEVYATTLGSIIRANTQLTNAPQHVFFS